MNARHALLASIRMELVRRNAFLAQLARIARAVPRLHSSALLAASELLLGLSRRTTALLVLRAAFVCQEL